MNTGWIKLHRNLLAWEWYDDINTTRLFIHLLLKANHAPKPWHGITIETGQHLISLRGLAKETKLSLRSVRTSLEHLKSTHELTQFATHGKSLVTIANYGKFQAKEEEATQFATQQLTNDRHTTDTLNKNYKNYKNKTSLVLSPKNRDNPLSSANNCPYKKIIKRFNRILPELPTIKFLETGSVRQKNIKTRWNKELPTLRDWSAYFIKTKKSDWLMGKVADKEGRAFHCSLDWLIKPSNCIKILENNYSNYR